MKLCIILLLLTLAAAEDVPNLRGVAGSPWRIEEYGPSGMPECRKVDQWCSTSSTTAQFPQFQCCEVGQLNTTETLTCIFDMSVNIPHFDGICRVVSSGEVEWNDVFVGWHKHNSAIGCEIAMGRIAESVLLVIVWYLVCKLMNDLEW